MKRALAGFFLLTALYVGALVWIDARRQVFDGLIALAGVLPVLMAVSLVTYAVRFARWRWLLARAGHVTPVGRGWLAYLSGFAFTATPGKVGELIRIRYHQPMGVPASRVIAAFVFERAFDLIAVLGLAALSIRDSRLMSLALVFVVLCLVVVTLPARFPSLMDRMRAWLDRRHLPRAASLCAVLGEAFLGCRIWLTPVDLAISAGLGLVAWGATALAFSHLLGRLGVTGLTGGDALAMYPMAMLAGAASMLPGGIGSTEAALVALLTTSGVGLAVAVLAAVGIRLATLWFAIVCGLIAAFGLELRSQTTLARSASPTTRREDAA
ncbi:lysylphosphatidylglycerol synthase transmembrane domain-containing protein [Roseateles sp. BYS96W]